MNKIEVICKDYREVEVSDRQLEELKTLCFCALAYSNFLSQYQLFCRSLSDFKKLVYSRAIDAELLKDYEYFGNVDLFVDAENSTMHATASFLKFTDLLPSLLQNCFPDSAVRSEINKLKSELYDDCTGKYLFLCELRNAIVHNRVNISITRGSDRRIIESNLVLKFGYFIGFDYFVRVCVNKKNKRELLLKCRDKLVDKNGNVDILKTLSDMSASIFNKLVSPHIKPLRAAMAEFKYNAQYFLVEGGIINTDELDDVYILHDKELLYSALMNSRSFELAKHIRTPIAATTINIAPSIFK
jgi:hypothetical protein